MANGIKVTNSGRKLAIHRIFESVPTYTAPLYFSVGTGTVTPTVADTDLANKIIIAGDTTKAIVTGYPIFDDANFLSTNRCLILTTECNGNSLSEFGLKNSDASPLLFSRIVFTPISKTSSIQVIFKEVDKIM
jgi:hypothetical protein